MGSAQGIQRQSGFRGREDTVDEDDDTTWFAPTNTNWIASALDTNFRVRFEIALTALNVNWDSGQFRLYYSHNGGSFTQVKYNSSVIKNVSSNVAGYNKGDDTTPLIPSGTPFKVDNNQVNEGDEFGDEFTGVLTWLLADSTPQYVETEWVLQLIGADLNSGDTIVLRLRKSSGAAFVGGYTYSPVIVVQNPQVEIKGKEFKIDGKELAIK